MISHYTMNDYNYNKVTFRDALIEFGPEKNFKPIPVTA